MDRIINSFLEIFSEYLEPDPGELAFHYTSTSGLLGILESKSIWMTERGFLNDPNELYYGLIKVETLLLTRLIDLMKAEESGSTEKHQRILKKLQELVGASREFDPTMIFIASLSLNGDLLSQWRGYADNGSGFCIGFKHQFFAEEKDCFAGRVIYSDIVQETIVKKFIANIAEDLEQLDEEKIEGFLGDTLNLLRILSCFFKSESFSEEKEYRVVRTIPLSRSGKIRLRNSNSGPIPFTELLIPEIESQVSLLRVGPRLSWEKNFRALFHRFELGKVTRSMLTLQ